MLRDKARVIPLMQTGCYSKDVLDLRNNEVTTNLFKFDRIHHNAYVKFLGRLGVVKNVRKISVHKTKQEH